MVEARLTLEPEVQEILTCIDNKQNFLLSGGAGSGKTYSLVQVIKQVISEHPTAKIACMTYTNAAVREIEERVNHKNLNVTTIHDFLWDNIKHFQKEIKKTLVTLLNDDEITKFLIEELDVVPEDYFDSLRLDIHYREYYKIREGIISHDEVLIVANRMFKDYIKLNDIVKDKYKFIFVDEYQDTDKAVIDIFLNQLNKSTRRNILGFFGDSMQSIYDDGVGNLDAYKGDGVGKVKEIQKKQNRRNPQSVIDLANKIRTDGLEQKPSSYHNAPNMKEGKIKPGCIWFLHSSNPDLAKVKHYLSETMLWNFEDSKNTKELNLTHNLIADKAGFKNLMEIYDNDPVISLKDDILKKIKDNKKNNKQEIDIADSDTFDIVVDKFGLTNRQKQLKKDVLFENQISTNLYNQLKDHLFSEVKKIYINKDALIDDKKKDKDDKNKKGSKRDNLVKHLFKIQNCVWFYANKQYYEFLKSTDYRIKLTSIEAKRTLKNNIDSLVDVGSKTIEEVIIEADEKEIILNDDYLKKFITQNTYLYNRVKDIKFFEFQKLYYYLEGKTPFSTKHKTKGTEFDNILVMLENGGWNDYNFSYLFAQEENYKDLVAGKSKTKSKLDSFPKILARTQKIFYVCCTRAKENLAVFYYNPSENVILKAKEWFGAVNVISLDKEQ